MQCPNCHFENMPGNLACVRCSAHLDLNSLDLVVHPPRAARWTKSLRRWWRLSRWGYEVRDQLSDAGLRTSRRRPQSILTDGAFQLLLAKAFVPGWPQLSLGNWRRSAVFGGVFALMAVAGLVMFGTPMGSVMLGIALATHLASVIDLLIAADSEARDRRLATPVLAAAVLSLLYLPLAVTCHRMFTVRRIDGNGPGLSAGDVFLFRRTDGTSAAVRPGDVVLYELPETRMQLGGQREAYLELDGQRIDRIIAGSGSRVSWDSRGLRVDNRPAAHLPLARPRPAEPLLLDVPLGHVCILPSTDPSHEIAAAAGARIWQQVSLVPTSRIVGRAIVRHYPWSRFTVFSRSDAATP